MRPGRNTEISVTYSIVGREPPASRRGDLAGQVPAPFAQASPGAQGDELLGLRVVVSDRRNREDEPALAEANRLDEDRAAGPGQDDHVAGIDVASKDQIIHR